MATYHEHTAEENPGETREQENREHKHAASWGHKLQKEKEKEKRPHHCGA